MNTGPAAAGPSPSNVGASNDVDTHVKAEMGAAALERVVAAARAAQEEHQRNTEDLRAVCDLCNVRRADLRGPCGHKYHARCIYSMPIIRCPVCDHEFGPDEGLFILPVEPYSAGMLFGDDDRRGREDQSQTRIGRWHTYETMYAQRIVADFEAGTMPLSEGTKLGTFLCNILNCSPSRLSKKLKIGKKYFQRCPDRPMGEEHIAKHREAQKRLSELEEMFLMAESQTNRGIANTQFLSERIQTEWRDRFIGHAHTVNQKLKNAWDWNSSRKKADLSAGALSKLLGSITPQKAELAVNSLAPFFLVTHNPNGGGSSSTGSGSGTPQHNASNAALGQAMIDNMLQQHTMRLFSPPTNVRSALGIPPQQALPSGVEPGVDGSVPFGSSSHQPFPSALAAARQAQHGAQQSPRRDVYDSKPASFDWFEQPLPCGQQQQHGQGTPMQTPIPHTQQNVPTPDGMGDITELGIWNSLGHDLAELGYGNITAIEDMDQDTLENVSSQWPHTHGQNSSLHDPAAFFMGGSSAPPPGSMTGMPPTVTVRDAGRGNPRPVWSSNPLGSAGSMGPGAGGAAGGNPGGGSGGGNPGGSGGNPGGGNGGGGGGGGSGGPPNDEGGDDGDNEDEGSHRFEDFIGNFLDQIPFEAVDVWVPLCNQDQEGSEVVLFHAGYFTNVKELEEWGEYSTNFSFRQGQGLPGRVYGSNESEWQTIPASFDVPRGTSAYSEQEDVNTLGHVNFLRLNGARNIGIRTSFGVPVVSRWGVTFVIVFYSRTTVQVNNDMKAFIERTVSAWKFDATVDTDSCPGDATPSAGKAGPMRA